MKTKRNIELTVEHSSFFLRRAGRRADFAWCYQCGGDVQMVAPEEAARFSRISPRLIYQQVESGRVHFLETSDGALLVCLDSISAEP